MAAGELTDGSPLERYYQVPLRVKGFDLRGPDDSQQTPGTLQERRFDSTNDGVIERLYQLELDSSQGWADGSALPQTVLLAPGETTEFVVPVTVPVDAAAGEVEETALTVVHAVDIGISDTETTMTTVVDQLQLFLPSTLGP